ncbi:Acyl-CoA-binding protein-like protein [Paramyrothecium foliicola]|nr:Acyl-CoA-binding protein-like protein [Paramyrothecium foliicola]
MADSVDRVFVHALNTVKKIPKTGASRPPPSDRLRLYGLYKQAMEGDVDGVMERPMPGPGVVEEELHRERDKWDAWNSQRGLSRTEAKRRYVEALIGTMHRYATTPDAKELVAELEFVWNQIKHNTPSSSNSSPKAENSEIRRFQRPTNGTDGPMKMLSPMSEQDEAELRSQRQMEIDEEEDAEHDQQELSGGSNRWQRKIERAITQLSAEVAALREQITTGREWKSKKARSLPSWAGWLAWTVMKHLVVDFFFLGLILLWMRRRKDRRLEDSAHRQFLFLRGQRTLEGFGKGRESPSDGIKALGHFRCSANTEVLRKKIHRIARPRLHIMSGPAAVSEETAEHAGEDGDPIPVLEAVAPSIFVKNTIDFSAPVPQQRVDRLPIAIAQLDHHASGARANMIALFEREHTRIVRNARAEERSFAAAGLTKDLNRASIITSQDQIDAMIDNMEAPQRPNVPTNVINVPPIQVPTNVGATPREWATNEILRLTNAALTDLRSFDKRVSERKEAFEFALQREQERRATS